MSENDEKAAQTAGDDVALERFKPAAGAEAKARRWFAHAKKAAETRNYEYAIELYVNGLAIWPDALEEGLKPLRVVATARRLAGGKPAGFLAARKRPVGGKDHHKSLNNALYLFGMDPSNIGYMEQILQLAAKTRCDRVAQWIAPVLVDAMDSAKRLSESRFEAACQAMGVAADIAMNVEDDLAAIEILEANIATAQIWARHHPDSHEAQRARSNASGKLAIVKGRFASAEGFEDSLKDGEIQKDIRDRDQWVHAADRTEQMIAKARKEWEENPGVPSKLIALVDLMIRTGGDKTENEAIALLEKEYASCSDYILKSKADDIRMRQLRRHGREIKSKAKAEPDRTELQEAVAQHVARQNQLELEIYRDRLRQYPTDLAIHFQYAVRLFRAGQIDEAIPLFQKAQSDARCRSESRLYLGRCFFEKGFHEQATATLRSAMAEAESTGGRLTVELNYWLARTLEASRQWADARKVYGNLIQLDYNYRDARQRLERLVAAEQG